MKIGINSLKLIGYLYLFIFSIELIRKTSVYLAPDIKSFLLQSLTPIKAVSVGWFTTSIVQSSGAISTIAAAFAGNNLISMSTAVFILIGATFGTTITALLVSFITTTKSKRNFRHGFEIALCYSIYSAFLVLIVFLLERFLGLFSFISLKLAEASQDKIALLHIPNLVEIITAPIINFLFERNHKLVLLILAFAILILSLKFIGKAIIEVLGGEHQAKKFIEKHFDSKYKIYFIGVFLTAVVFSSSITISLLVPLAVVNLIGLRRAIPFILGADVGTFTDVFLASVILNNTPALATAFTYMLIALTGTIIFLPNTEFLYKTTKYTSKKLIKISRKKALYILIAFIAIPLLILIL